MDRVTLEAKNLNQLYDDVYIGHTIRLVLSNTKHNIRIPSVDRTLGQTVSLYTQNVIFVFTQKNKNKNNDNNVLIILGIFKIH